MSVRFSRGQEAAELLLLAALWGASFLFMRVSAAEFGAVALVALRVAIAAAVLVPILFLRGAAGALARHWKPIFVVGLINSALPFLGFSYAALSITAGLSSIFNATAPLWAALIAWLWLRETLSASRLVGLAIGFAGATWLAWDKASFEPGGAGLAVLACIAASVLYGLAANYTKRRLDGVAPLAVATGSQLSASVALALPGALAWPAAPPSAGAWGAVLALGVLCTALAYVLYFRLIEHAGAHDAIAVTFLIPAFAVLWGYVFLAETVTLVMVLGCAVILAGTGLATGFIRIKPSARVGTTR